MEKDNKHDPFAVAVYDGTRKVANLKRDAARVLYEILSSPYVKSNALLRPTDIADVKTRKVGPQQPCAIVFKCDTSDIESVKAIVTRQSHTGIYVKVMELPAKRNI